MDKFLRPEKFDVLPNTPSSRSQWIHWLKTFTNFTNTIPDSDKDQKLSVLINFISADIFENISETTSFDEAIELLNAIYVKPENEIMARHLLAIRRQSQEESVDVFLQALRLLAKQCNFKAVTAQLHAEESIRDSFISGINDGRVRERLLENVTLNLKEAFSQALALELAQKHALAYSPINLSAVQSTYNSNTVQNDNTQVAAVGGNEKKCYFCGNYFHPRRLCPARSALCKNCQRRGHFAKVCLSAKTGQSTLENNAPLALGSILGHVTISGNNGLTRALSKIRVNEHNCQAILDSGSTHSFIDKSFASLLNVKQTATESNITLASTSSHIKLMAYCTCTLVMGTERYVNFRLNILPNLCANVILGHDFMSQHSTFSIDFNGNRPPITLAQLSPMSIDCPHLFTNLSPNIKPIRTPSRRYSKSCLEYIHSEVNKLLLDGIIEPSYSPWRAQVLVTSNGNRRRMVIDYSSTIYRFTHLNAYPLSNIADLVSEVAQYKIFSKIDLRSAYYQVPIREEDKAFTAFEADGQLFQYCRLPFGLTNAVAAFQRVMTNFIKVNSLRGVFCYLDDIIICGKSLIEHDDNLNLFCKAATKVGFTLNQDKCDYRKKDINFLGYNINNGCLKPDPDRLQPLRDLALPKDKASLLRTIGLLSYYSKWVPNY